MCAVNVAHASWDLLVKIGGSGRIWPGLSHRLVLHLHRTRNAYVDGGRKLEALPVFYHVPKDTFADWDNCSTVSVV